MKAARKPCCSTTALRNLFSTTVPPSENLMPPENSKLSPYSRPHLVCSVLFWCFGHETLNTQHNASECLVCDVGVYVRGELILFAVDRTKLPGEATRRANREQIIQT